MKTLGGIKTLKLTQIEVDAIKNALRDYLFHLDGLNRDRGQIERPGVMTYIGYQSNAVLLDAFDKFEKA